MTRPQEAAGGFGGFDFGGFGGGGMDFDLGDILGGIFGGGGGSRRSAAMQGSDIQCRVTLSFEEAVFGCKKDVSFNRIEKCPDCSGSGAAKGTSAETCPNCGGSGQVKTTKRTALGMFQTTSSCERCHGTGKIIKLHAPTALERDTSELLKRWKLRSQRE